MKVLVAHNAYIHRGGEDLCVERETAALQEAGIDVSVYQPLNQSRASSYIAAMQAPLGGGDEEQLENILKQNRPDILHAHNLFPLLSPRIFRVAGELGTKTVLTLHNFRPLCLNGLFMTPDLETCERCANGSYFPGIQRGCYRGSTLQSAGLAAHLWSQRDAYKQVNRFIAPSAFLRNKFVHYGFDQNKIKVQGHFLPEMPMTPPSDPDPYILYLGRLSDEKGVRWLLSTFAAGKNPLRLKIAGSGPLEKEVLQASQQGTLDFLGYLTGTEKTAILRKAAAVVIPSECYENFPLVVPEANAWGVPVVAADHGGLHDLIIPGQNGFLYPARDTASFWQAIESVARTSSARDLRIKTQLYAKTTYAKDLFLKQRLKIYLDLLDLTL